MSTEIETRRSQLSQNWAKFGLSKEDLNLELKNTALNIIKSVEKKVTKENVVECEEVLKNQKSAAKDLVAKRKTLTDRLDSVKSALMEHEKSLSEPLKKLENEIISVKKTLAAEKAEKERKQKLKNDEITAFQTYCNNYEFELKSFVQKRVNDAYDYALENPQDIPLDPYFQKAKEKIEKEIPKFNFEQKHNNIQVPNFELDILDLLVETFENAMLLIASFLANKEKAKEKTTTKKWFSFSASNCISALEKLKNEDNNFAPNGVKFKEVDKL
jgi:hypothetical protein